MNSAISSIYRNTVILTSYFYVQEATYPFIEYVPYVWSVFGTGNDLKTFNTTVGCETHCNQTKTCVGYTIGMVINECSLKSTVSTFHSNPYFISYLKTQTRRNYSFQNGVEYQGENIAYFYGAFTFCSQACDALPGCIGYVKAIFFLNDIKVEHVDNKYNCWMKSSIHLSIDPIHGIRNTVFLSLLQPLNENILSVIPTLIMNGKLLNDI